MPKRNLIFLLIVAAVAGGAVWLFHAMQLQHRRQLAQQQAELAAMAEMNQQMRSTLLAIRLLTREGETTAPDLEELAREIDRLRRSRQLTEAQRRRITEGGLRGMVEVFGEVTGDPYCRYVPHDGKAAIEARMMGHGRGLGLRVTLRGGQALVTHVLGGSPAHREGLVPGDRVIEINGLDIVDIDPAAARRRLNGQADDPVTLTVLRAPGVKAGATRVQQVRLVPKEFEVETVRGLYRDAEGRWVYRLSDGLAYVRITEFVERTREQLERACRRSPQAQGLVLDLRDNPGGRPEFAAQVANWFLSEGEIFRIVSIKDAKPEQKAYAAHKEGTYSQDVRLAVLIDGETASAAEIVAGALRVHHRAVLIGTSTRGKTRVQSMVPISDLGMIVVSTGRFYLGGEEPGENPQAFSVERIAPDRKVAPPSAAAEALDQARAQAAAVPGKPQFVDLNLPEGETLGDELLRCDPQLSVAAELLRTEELFHRLRRSAPPWLNTADER